MPALDEEPNPVPVKYALSLMNAMPARVRLPLVELSPASKAELASALRKCPDRVPAWTNARSFEREGYRSA